MIGITNVSNSPNVKSVNYYTVTFDSGDTNPQDFTINTLGSVENSIVTFAGIPTSTLGWINLLPTLEITGVSTVTMDIISGQASSTVEVTFIVIEFYNLKNTQSGTLSFSTSSSDVSLTGFSNTDKMLAVTSFTQEDNDTAPLTHVVRHEIINSTTLRVSRINVLSSATVKYKVIEFY